MARRVFYRSPLLSSALALLVLSGCANSAYDGLIEQRTAEAQSKIETARVPSAERKHEALEISDSIWLGDRPIEMPRGEPLPETWEKDDAFALRSDTYLSLAQIAAIISTETRIPVRLTGGADRVAGATGGAGGQPGGQGGAGQGEAASNGMILSYEGSLSRLLDLVCGYFNVNWEYRNGNINISRYETRTFVMDALPGVIAVRGTESQGGEGSTAEPLATPSIDVWQDIRGTLTNIVGGEGTIDVSQSSGTIVVSTTSDRMERVSSYLSEENERLSRQVAINIEIYTVDINDAEAYGLDGLNILTNLGGSWADLAFTGVDSEIASSAASLPFTIFEPNEISGTNGIFRALSTLGKTARVAQIPLTTLNNRPAVQNVGTDTNYVSSSTTTTTDTSVATELETETVRAGVSISVLPRMMVDGRILLQYALTQTDVLNIDTFSSSGTSVQLPQTQNIAFSQQVMLLSGSTLVLAGYDQGDTAKETRGLGRPMTWMLGGGVNGSQRRQIVVIAITPREIMIRRPEAL